MRTTIITGGASGIGLAIATKFAREGDHVAILDLREEDTIKACQELQKDGASVSAHAVDVSDGEAVSSAIDTIADERGGIQVLVNNAGIAHIGDAGSTTGEDMDRLYRVNVKGVYHGIHHSLPHLLKNDQSVILNLASIASLTGISERFAYSMTKGAVLTMSYSVAIDYIDKGLRCNCLCPARVHTPFVDGYLDAHYPDNKEEMFEKLSKAQPIGRMAQPSEIADLSWYLCSDASSFITGQAWPIDGGYMNAR